MNYKKYLDIPSTYHNSIHLIKCQLRSFRELIFHKCKTFVFLRNWIPAHINGLNRSKRNESLSYCIFFELKTNTPNVNSKIKTTIFINNIQITWLQLKIIQITVWSQKYFNIQLHFNIMSLTLQFITILTIFCCILSTRALYYVVEINLLHNLQIIGESGDDWDNFHVLINNFGYA